MARAPNNHRCSLDKIWVQPQHPDTPIDFVFMTPAKTEPESDQGSNGEFAGPAYSPDMSSAGSADQNSVGMFSRAFKVKGLIPWVTKGGLAVLDYGLISGSNFVLGVLLARWLSPRDYGAYALVFSFFILVGFLYQCLLLEPLSVFSGTLFHQNLRGYLKK